MLVVIFIVVDNSKEEEKRQNYDYALTINFRAFGV